MIGACGNHTPAVTSTLRWPSPSAHRRSRRASLRRSRARASRFAVAGPSAKWSGNHWKDRGRVDRGGRARRTGARRHPHALADRGRETLPRPHGGGRAQDGPPRLRRRRRRRVPMPALQRALEPAIRAVVAGLACFPLEVRASTVKPVLTNREKQILAMVVLGMSNADIARRLHLTESTVKSHLSAGYTKLASAAVMRRRRPSSTPRTGSAWASCTSQATTAATPPSGRGTPRARRRRARPRGHPSRAGRARLGPLAEHRGTSRMRCGARPSSGSSHVDRDGALGVVAQREAGDAEERRLLLNAAGVGHAPAAREMRPRNST